MVNLLYFTTFQCVYLYSISPSLPYTLCHFRIFTITLHSLHVICVTVALHIYFLDFADFLSFRFLPINEPSDGLLSATASAS